MSLSYGSARIPIVVALAAVFACGTSEDAATGGPISAIDAGSANPDSSTREGGVTAPDAGDDGSVSPSFADPAKDGPFAIAETDLSVNAATGDTLSLHAVYPTAKPGPYPVVFIGAGYQIATTQYYGYAKRLATHGLVGVTVGFNQGVLNQLRDAENMKAALDWAASPGTLTGTVDATRAGVMGHSRGGKAAVLAAVSTPGFKAVLGLDPVDSKPPLPCNTTTQCPDASEAIAALKVPSAFLGETLDATAVGQACAPAADNFTTFYTGAPSPSLEVTIAGASHVSFVADTATCGFTCSFCKTATRPQAEVLGLAYAYTVAFFRRTLGNEVAYDAYLTGAEAKARYVTPGVATLRTK